MEKQILTCLFILIVTTTAPVHSAQYYCVQEGEGYSSYSLYDTKTDCSVWKDPFFSKDTYTNCMQGIAKAKDLYNQGKCIPVEERKHVIDGCNCSVEFVPSPNKIISHSCSGTESCNVDNAIKKLHLMYLQN